MITTLDHLDTSTAAWLAQRDPALIHLPAALGAIDCGWQLHDVQWAPGLGCRLAYRVEDENPAALTFVAVNVEPSGWTHHDFRNDPALPGISSAVDPAEVMLRLGPLVTEPVRHCHVQPVRYRPGVRCVLRYDVTTTSGAARYYAKVFSESVFADAADRAMRVGAAAPPELRVNPALAIWPEQRAAVWAAIAGRPASAVLQDDAVVEDDGVSTARGADLAYGIGRLLAGFHAVSGVSVPVRTAADQTRVLTDLLPAVNLVDAGLGDRLRRLVDGLGHQHPPGDCADALIHGGFRPGQVIVDEAHRLHLIDLDGVSRGEAGQDLGSALGHLSWMAVRKPGRWDCLPRLHQALLTGYQSSGGAVDPVSLVWWRTAALAQIAARRFRRLEVADWAMAAQLVDLAENLLDDRPTGEL